MNREWLGHDFPPAAHLQFGFVECGHCCWWHRKGTPKLVGLWSHEKEETKKRRWGGGGGVKLQSDPDQLHNVLTFFNVWNQCSQKREREQENERNIGGKGKERGRRDERGGLWLAALERTDNNISSNQSFLWCMCVCLCVCLCIQCRVIPSFFLFLLLVNTYVSADVRTKSLSFVLSVHLWFQGLSADTTAWQCELCCWRWTETQCVHHVQV